MLSLKHWHGSTLAKTLSMAHYSRKARQRQASTLVLNNSVDNGRLWRTMKVGTCPSSAQGAKVEIHESGR